MAKRDYYEILGLSKGAGVDDIKSAYRGLALKYHPDRVSVDKKKEAEERFKEISEAYEVLIDAQKRATYDQYGHAGVDSSFKQGGFSWQDFHHFDDLKDIFGGFDLSDLFRGFGFGSDIFGIFEIIVVIVADCAVCGNKASSPGRPSLKPRSF